MRRIKFITTCVCCVCLVSFLVLAAQVSAEDAKGKVPISPREGAIRLFNGMDLSGLYTWLKDTKYQDPHKVFTIQDGMLHISGNGIGYVCTEKEYKDYHMIIEFKWGEQTWGERKDRARDTGVLVHCVGPDGNYKNWFMASIAANIIEGGVGDLILVLGKYADGSPVPLSLTAEVTKDRDGETVWKKGGRKKTFSGGRINWSGRDPDWKDVLGFRGKNDIDGPHGEWTRMEVICDGGHILVKINGVVVNEAFDAYPSAGKILLQAQQAEIYIRRWELWPLGKAPVFKAEISKLATAQVSDEDANGKVPISPGEDAIRLFNGMDLSNLYTWHQETGYEDPRRVFTVQDGLLHISGDGIGYICTKKEYKNYHLIVEFKWGEQTWGGRKDHARDTGVLVHCVGPDGNYKNRFMASIEAQIIEGGVGDFILVSGKYADGKPVPLSLTAEVTKDRDGETVWKKGGRKKTFSGVRVNWFGRDPDWKDVLGFRGKNDIESPHGEWTRMEVICDGGHIINKVNGVVVNEGFDAFPSAGKILIQSELAEVYIRRWELWPLGKVSISTENP